MKRIRIRNTDYFSKSWSGHLKYSHFISNFTILIMEASIWIGFLSLDFGIDCNTLTRNCIHCLVVSDSFLQLLNLQKNSLSCCIVYMDTFVARLRVHTYIPINCMIRKRRRRMGTTWTTGTTTSWQTWSTRSTAPRRPTPPTSSANTSLRNVAGGFNLTHNNPMTF